MAAGIAYPGERCQSRSAICYLDGVVGDVEDGELLERTEGWNGLDSVAVEGQFFEVLELAEQVDHLCHILYGPTYKFDYLSSSLMLRICGLV